MTFRDLRRDHLGLIGLYSTRYAVRSGAGIIFVLLALLAGLLVAYTVMAGTLKVVKSGVFEQGRGNDDERAQFERAVEAAKGPASWVLGESDDASGRGGDWSHYLLRERPALLSAILLLLLFMTPLFSMMASFNLYAGDIGTRGIRYLLPRVARVNIYLGRYIGAVLFASIIFAILLTTIVVYLGAALDYYTWGSLLAWGFRGWLAMTILLIPYAALCGWISGAVNGSFSALFLSLLAIFAPLVVAKIASVQFEHADLVRAVLPWKLQNRLLHHTTGGTLLAVLGCFGYAAVFFFLGCRNFLKRDL